MLIATGQFTIRDENDIEVGKSSPKNPIKDQMWLDTSSNPSVLKRYNGKEWDVVNDVSEHLNNLKTKIETAINYLNSLSSDNILTAIEKKSIHNIMQDIIKKQEGLIKQCNLYQISVEKLINYFNILYDYLYGKEAKKQLVISDKIFPNKDLFVGVNKIINGLLLSLDTDSFIDRKEFTEKFNSYYLERQNTLNLITSHTKKNTEEVKKITETNSSEINVQKERIIANINNTKIIEGKQKTLEDNYNKTLIDVNSIKNTIGQHKTLIDSATGKILGMETSNNIIEKKLNSTIETISQTRNIIENNKKINETKISEINHSLEGLSLNVNGIKKDTDTKIQQIKTTLDNTKEYINSEIVNLNTSIKADLNGIHTEVSKKTDKNSIISAINQSAEEIKIDASRIQLNGITTFNNNTGMKAVEVSNNAVKLFNWKQNGDFIGSLTANIRNKDNITPILSLSHRKNSCLTLGYTDDDYNFINYIEFDKNNLLGNNVKIQVNEEISFGGRSVWLDSRKKNRYFESTEEKFCIEAKHGVQIADIDNKRITTLLGSDRTAFAKWNQNYYYAEFFPGECRLGTGNGKSYANFFAGGFALRSGNGEAYLWADAGSSDIYTKSGVNMRIQGDLSVNGKKNRIVKDTIYGDLMLNAIESTECWFTDCRIDQDSTNVDGECIIWFDDKFLQTVNTRCKYKIDVTPIGEFANNGEITYVRVIEKTEKYFKVKGTPNTLFDWTITAKQKGYEKDRLEILHK